MTRTEVQSSNIASVGYDSHTGVMEVEFRTGKVYTYPNVSAQEFQDLLSAPSIGSHFHKHFRSRHNARKED